MAFLRRIVLFLVVNALVVLTMSIIFSIFGIGTYLTPYGIDYQQLALFCALWGMGGSFISLLTSRALVKWTCGVQVIDPNTSDPSLRSLVQLVHELSRKANLPVMPEVGIYDSPDPNAFATGPSKSMALVAVSTGLLSRMNSGEIAGVLGHEVTHISNGDMVTMTLLQGVINAFVMFLSRIIAFAVTQTRGQDNEYRSPGFLYYIVQFVLEIVFMILGSMVVAWFSRWREYRADAGGAKLAGKQNMIAALDELRKTFELVNPHAQATVQTLQISSRPSGLMALFSSHPPLEQRIRRLQESTEG